jgi:ribosomal protein S4E
MKIGSLCLIVNGKYSGILATVVAIKKTYNFEDSIHLIKFDGNKYS